MDYTPEKVMKIFKILTQDVITAQRTMEAHDSQYARRVYVRVAFALIEGLTHETKVSAISFARIRGVNFSPAELALLKEESYELSNKGKPLVRPKFLRLADNFRFAAFCYAKAFDSDIKLNVEGEGWECFKKAIKIRHRITHPKLGGDLDISNEELQIVEKAMDWYRVSSRELFRIFEKSGMTAGLGGKPAPP